MEYYAILILYYVMTRFRETFQRLFALANPTDEDPPTPPRSSSLASEESANKPTPEDDTRYGQKKLGPNASRDAHLTRSQDSARQQIEQVSLFSTNSIPI